jgi:lycopene beta-cyclase
MTVATVGVRGAGLSGLSVARELLKNEPRLKISIFDTRLRLPHPQRTFCFFKTRELAWPSIPTFSWNTVAFRGASFERRLDVSGSPYTMIRGDDFFSRTITELEEKGTEFIWGCPSVEIVGNTLKADGQTRTFDVVIDGAFEARTSKSTLWQSFAGVWVTADEAIFDSTTAVVMDLHESSAEAPVSFSYILPTSAHEALVEHTTFSPSPMPKEYHLERCFKWIDHHHSGEIHCGATEYGLIPMGLQAAVPQEGLIVGSNAGVIRPATGYAFVRAQQHAQMVATCVIGQKRLSGRPYPQWLTIADGLFLRALRDAPERGRYMMEQLLLRARGESLIAFLSGNVAPLDALSIWSSVPKYTMIRSLLRI